MVEIVAVCMALVILERLCIKVGFIARCADKAYYFVVYKGQLKNYWRDLKRRSYPPLSHGSRFGSHIELALWYGALSLKTVMRGIYLSFCTRLH
jgi:hypothetical protein